MSSTHGKFLNKVELIGHLGRDTVVEKKHHFVRVLEFEVQLVQYFPKSTY